MGTNYGHLLWLAFTRVSGWMFGAGGVLASLLFWILVPQAHVPMKLIVPMFLFLVFCLAIFIQASIIATYEARRPLPRVSATLAGVGPLILLIDPSDLFSYDAMVTVYILDSSGFERIVGVGAVTNIQEDRKIQVTLVAPAVGQEDTMERLRQNDASVLSRLAVKPHVPRSYLGLMLRGGA